MRNINSMCDEKGIPVVMLFGFQENIGRHEHTVRLFDQGLFRKANPVLIGAGKAGVFIDTVIHNRPFTQGACDVGRSWNEGPSDWVLESKSAARALDTPS